jgi:hypothetical protein
MTRVSNIDQFTLILRQRLLERTKGAQKGRGRAHARTNSESGLARVRELAAIGQADARQVRRALVEGLLADQFGPELVNEARFQQVVERVSQTLEADEQTRSLLDRVVADLEAGV